MADDQALGHGVAVGVVGRHGEARIVQRCDRGALALAHHVGHLNALGAERHDVLHGRVLLNLGAAFRIGANDQALFNCVGIGWRSRARHEPLVLDRLLRLFRVEALHVGHGDLSHALRYGNVDFRALLALVAGLRVLADYLPGRNLVVVLLVGGAQLEAGLLQDGRGLLDGLARHVGHGVARGEAAHEGECRKAHDGQRGNDAHHDADGLLVVLLLAVVGTVVLRAAGGSRGLRAARAHAGGHDGGAVCHAHGRNDAAHDGRLGAGEAAAHVHRASGQVVVQRVAHVLRGGEALGGILRHGAHDDGFERGVDIGVDLSRRGRQVVHLLHGHAQGIGAVEGQLARGGLVQHDAERVDVAGGGELLALRLFRRDIVRRAQHGRRLRHDRVLGARDAEVHDLHVAVGLHHDVLRLDVAVDDVQVVRHRQGLAHLRADLGHLALVDGAALVDGRLQVAAAHELHDDVVRAVVLAPVVHVHDVGALQVGRSGGLLLEALGEVGIGGVLGQHDLHRNQASEHVVLRAVHLGHAADTDALGYLVAVVEHPACHVSGHVSAPLGHMPRGGTACRC